MQTKIILPQDNSPKTDKLEGKPDYAHLLKIVVLGAPAGKTQLMNQFINKYYDDHYNSTIGVEFHTQNIRIGNKIIKLQIWDTAGLERFRVITKSYTRNANAILFVFDLTDKSSFEYIKKLIHELRSAPETARTKFVLIGTKCDLVEKRTIKQTEIDELLNDETNRLEAYIETSAKTAINIDAPFIQAANAVVKQFDLDWESAKNKPKESAPLESISPKKPEMKQLVLANLNAYIDRIERNQNQGQPNFSYGFWFFSKSRSINRQANYLLAKSLRDELAKPAATLAEVFSDVNETRRRIIIDNKLYEKDGYVVRGINSSELNTIIDFAAKSIRDSVEKTPLLMAL